jgi:hypothetical protein
MYLASTTKPQQSLNPVFHLCIHACHPLRLCQAKSESRISRQREGKMTRSRPDDVLLAHDRRKVTTAGVYARTHDTVHHTIDSLPTRAHKLIRRGRLNKSAAIMAARTRRIDRKRLERCEARHASGCIAPTALYYRRRRWRSAREQTREARAGGRTREEWRRTALR